MEKYEITDLENFETIESLEAEIERLQKELRKRKHIEQFCYKHFYDLPESIYKKFKNLKNIKHIARRSKKCRNPEFERAKILNGLIYGFWKITWSSWKDF